MSGRVETARIAACIVCHNEADRLVPCLESVKWADEILLLDLESVDESAKLAKAYGARVLPHAPVPTVELVRNEIANAAASDWILVLDPDERLSPALAEYLSGLRGRDDIDAVAIPRTNHDLGYPPRHPLHRFERQIRMYRRSRVQWPTAPNALPDVPPERVHDVPLEDPLTIIHDRSRTIPEVLERMIRYAPAHARHMIGEGRDFAVRDMLVSLGKEFHLQFVHGKAWQDGVPGLLRAGFLVAFDFFVWAEFWQESGRGRVQEDDVVLRRIGTTAQVGWGLWRAARRMQSLAAGLRGRRATEQRDPGDARTGAETTSPGASVE